MIFDRVDLCFNLPLRKALGNGEHVDNHKDPHDAVLNHDDGDHDFGSAVMMVMMMLIKTSLIVIKDSQMCFDLPWKAILYRAFSIKLKNVKYFFQIKSL